MHINYKCSHCNQHVGQLKMGEVNIDRLGWERLTIEERSKMIKQNSDGDIEIETICENCEQTLQAHPNYYELDFFIH